MIRIAIADDHQQVRETWEFILSTNPEFSVVAICKNGQEAIDAALQTKPDVFLMDINMEPVNGIEATETIIAANPDAKIVAMSIHVEPVYVRRMLSAGALSYVTKNSSYTEVFEAIKAVHNGKLFICKEVCEKMPELCN